MYALISEIEDLPNSVKKQLFDELLDANAQKGALCHTCTYARTHTHTHLTALVLELPR